MKCSYQPSKWPLLQVVLIVLLLNSCETKIKFNQTRKVNSSSLSPVQSVSSYSLIYNPKANGTIVVTLSDQSQYTADKLNATQLSSLLTLLKTPGLQFDTKNEEFKLKGGVQ